MKFEDINEIDYEQEIEVSNQNEEEEDDSIYIKDNKRMHKIQIEGDPNDYLMDGDGNIYDMKFQYVGTADPEVFGQE